MSDWRVAEVRMGREVVSGPFAISPEGKTVLSHDGRATEPRGRIYRAREIEESVRREDPEIDRRWTAIERDLEGRRPGAILRGKDGVYYDFTDEAELLGLWMKTLDDAHARFLAKLPPLPVREGDFVVVGGAILRVGRTDLLTRTVTLEQLDERGAVQTSIPRCRADRLTPLAGSPDPAALLAPAAPAHMTDTYDQIRFRMRSLKELLREEGIWSDVPYLTKKGQLLPRPGDEVLAD